MHKGATARVEEETAAGGRRRKGREAAGRRQAEYLGGGALRSTACRLEIQPEDRRSRETGEKGTPDVDPPTTLRHLGSPEARSLAFRAASLGCGAPCLTRTASGGFPPSALQRTDIPACGAFRAPLRLLESALSRTSIPLECKAGAGQGGNGISAGAARITARAHQVPGEQE